MRSNRAVVFILQQFREKEICFYPKLALFRNILLIGWDMEVRPLDTTLRRVESEQAAQCLERSCLAGTVRTDQVGDGFEADVSRPRTVRLKISIGAASAASYCLTFLVVIPYSSRGPVHAHSPTIPMKIRSLAAMLRVRLRVSSHGRPPYATVTWPFISIGSSQSRS